MSATDALEEERRARFALVARMRAAVRLMSPDDMTPWAKRMFDSILDEEETGAAVVSHPPEATNG